MDELILETTKAFMINKFMLMTSSVSNYLFCSKWFEPRSRIQGRSILYANTHVHTLEMGRIFFKGFLLYMTCTLQVKAFRGPHTLSVKSTAVPGNVLRKGYMIISLWLYNRVCDVLPFACTCTPRL